jgi:hypothetical protein
MLLTNILPLASFTYNRGNTFFQNVGNNRRLEGITIWKTTIYVLTTVETSYSGYVFCIQVIFIVHI